MIRFRKAQRGSQDLEIGTNRHHRHARQRQAEAHFEAHARRRRKEEAQAPLRRQPADRQGWRRRPGACLHRRHPGMGARRRPPARRS